MEQLRYSSDVAQALRQAADLVESGRLAAESAVLVTGGIGELVVVSVMGGIDSQSAIGSLVIGQHILLNTVMPDGNANGD